MVPPTPEEEEVEEGEIVGWAEGSMEVLASAQEEDWSSCFWCCTLDQGILTTTLGSTTPTVLCGRRTDGLATATARGGFSGEEDERGARTNLQEQAKTSL